MSQPKVARDLCGNELFKDDLVTVHFNTIPVFKVVVVESGGIHTAQGVTPATVRIICDMTLKQIPGVPFTSLAKLVSPSSQAIIEGIADKLPQG